MLVERMKKMISVGIGSFLMVMIYSCASIGTPNGGPYDEEPPKFVSSTPAPNQTNYRGNTVDILFDEIIQIEKPSENVVITPPQRQLPIIRAIGRRATVELKDTLRENTTYTIDFTNSIADNNEKNVYENFTFAFSTGDMIDTLEVSGILLNAENLEPMPGITVGLHLNLEDSAFTNLPFDRTSRTNDRGKFTIRNIKEGTYRIYALNDVNRDYMFDQPGEDIAFLDTLIVPTFEYTSREDTVWKDSLTIDTIKTVHFTRYLPDDIELRLFKEDFSRQYRLRPERNVANMFTLRFNAPLDTIPTPVPLNFEPEIDDWYFEQTIEGGLAVNYWLTDPAVWMNDTLQIEVTYPRSDSLNVLRPQTDTLSILAPRVPRERRRKKDDEEEKIEFLSMTVTPSSSIEVFDSIRITFTEPVTDLSKDMFYMNQMVDSVWVPVEFEMLPDTTNTLSFLLIRPWRYAEEYLLEVDSATIFSIYGRWNDTYSNQFKVKTEDEYGHLYINISGHETTSFVELLNSSDAPVRKGNVVDGGVLFMNLRPDKYYARLVEDANNNGEWDTGNYAEKRQPEKVYYYPGVLDIMRNWQVEESWDIKALPPNRQKPLDITKNKPKEVTRQKRDYRDEGRNQSSSSSSRSLSF